MSQNKAPLSAAAICGGLGMLLLVGALSGPEIMPEIEAIPSYPVGQPGATPVQSVAPAPIIEGTPLPFVPIHEQTTMWLPCYPWGELQGNGCRPTPDPEAMYSGPMTLLERER